MNVSLRKIILSENIEKKVRIYSGRALWRISLVLVMALPIYLKTDNVFVSLIFSAIFESVIVDMYTNRSYPPAYNMLYYKMNELKSKDPEVLYLFGLINGGSMLVLYILFFVV